MLCSNVLFYFIGKGTSVLLMCLLCVFVAVKSFQAVTSASILDAVSSDFLQDSEYDDDFK